MKIMLYVLIYSFLGFILEWVINIAYFGGWVDNSVLFGPYQPMYGIGVVLTLFGYYGLNKTKLPFSFRLFFLCVIAITATGVSEFISGSLYERFYDQMLWDYRLAFPVCTHPYVCIIPTGLFGLLSAMTVVYIHPIIEGVLIRVPRVIQWILVSVFVLDIVLTYGEVLL